MDMSLMREEIHAYYSTAYDVSELERQLHETSAAHPEWTVFERKSMSYALIAERCEVKVFRNLPFYYLVCTGRDRRDLYPCGLGGWLRQEPFGAELSRSSREKIGVFHELNLCTMAEVTDTTHQTFGYDNIFSHGFEGVIERAQVEMPSARDDMELTFLQSVVDGCRAVIRLAQRMGGQAAQLARDEVDPVLRGDLWRIAATAARVPAQPPATFYEALNTVLFCRHVISSLDLNLISVFGHIDRLLYPFYERDIAAGTLTPQEARRLMTCFLALSDIIFDFRGAPEFHVGTNGTIFLGGCDSAGNIIYNELTDMIMDIYEEHSLIDPKLNIRVSSRHPDAFFQRIAANIVSQRNHCAVFNDDVLIPANVAVGKSLEDCRTYIGGGCQENVLANCEINNRATIYFNLAGTLMMGFYPERFRKITDVFGLDILDYNGCDSFDALYGRFLKQLHRVTKAVANERTRTEADSVRYNPSPVLSGSIDDCIQKRRDIMDGGARYSNGSVGQVGIGELIDSLYAIRRAVYEEKRLSLGELAQILDRNFKGDADLQWYLRGIAKYGGEDEEMMRFSAMVFADVAKATSGFPTSRGGIYEPSLFDFTVHMPQGRATMATPSGRPAGQKLSDGMSPSQTSRGDRYAVTQVINALKPIDMTEYPVVAVLNLKLPASNFEPTHVEPLLRVFVENGGSCLQINCVDQRVLIEARDHPELHPDLVVRVSGYSSYFNVLSDSVKDDIINRAVGS